MNHALRCTLPATAEAVDEVCARLRQTFLAGLPAGERFAVELLAREALSNAVLHGAGGNPSGRIACAIERVEEGIRIRVRDRGTGFDWQSWQRQHVPAKGESGRGLHILYLYASQVRFNRKGNHVEIIRTFRKGVGHGL